MRSFASSLSVLMVEVVLLFGCQAPDQFSDQKEAWNAINNPSNFGAYSQHPYHSIPRSGRIAQLPWSDYYWSTLRGGVSYRWQSNVNSKDYRTYLYDIPSAEGVASFNAPTIATLSPSEKYDIALSRTDMPLTKSERSNTLKAVINGAVPSWVGLCHGWAAASISEREPRRSVSVTSHKGQSVTFYPSDLKALLTKVYADANLRRIYLGERCTEVAPGADPRGRPVASPCRDTNPGALHLVVADFIAIKKIPFIADISPAAEVWNHPIVGYSFIYENLRSLRSSDPDAKVRAPGTSQLVDVRLTLEFVKERLPSGFAHGAITAQSTYTYTLELNNLGRIIGGEWLSASHPDILWAFTNKPSGVVNGINLDWLRRLVEHSNLD